MDAREFDSETCSVARAVEVLGDRWTVLVLRDVFNGVRRFDDLARHLGIARDVLTRRLGALVDHGVLERVPYRDEGTRTRYEYRLTEAGWALRPVMVALLDWGDTYRRGRRGSPMSVVHAACGEPVHAVLRCEKGHRVTPSTRLALVPGPGAKRIGA